MNKDLLWEIGVEEIPSRFLPPVIEQLEKLSRSELATAGLSYDELQVYATPRRLALLVSGLSDSSADTETEAKGPAVKAAYDENGQPTKALLGFCRGQGVEPSQVQQKEINGNLYIYVVKKLSGKPARELLPAILLSVTEKLYFPKPMRWGYNTLRFVRPVRWLVALFGNEVLNVEFGGVRADRYSRGHRLLGSDHIELSEPAEYLTKLEQNYVICDQQRRRDMCWSQIQQVAAEIGGQVHADDELLEEVTFLVEYPTALSGGFEEKYLDLPEELVITPMREHQRYFPVYNAAGELLPRFITVRNGDGRHLDVVAQGNEKVLRARLADAEFFYVEDLRDNMDDKVEGLANVVFHEKLGTMRQKVSRIVTLSTEIGRMLGYSQQELAWTRRAAYLAKADLGSRVVYEFPELQGIIGEYYAKAAGEDAEVAQAIREHYLPRFAGDELPESKAGVAVALADKMDSICGFFSVGLIPSGSQDPYALRRAAAGCVQIIMRHQLELRLRELLPLIFGLVEADAPSLHPAQLDKGRERLESTIQFLNQRMANLLGDEGVSYDVINAVERVAVAKADLFGVLRRARALNSYRRNERFQALLNGFTRSANILRSAEKTDENTGVIDPALFADNSERELYAQVSDMSNEVKSLVDQGEYQAALEKISVLTAYIDNFFERVMVMDKDPAIRTNRIALLREVVTMTSDIGDLSKLVEQ